MLLVELLELLPLLALPHAAMQAAGGHRDERNRHSPPQSDPDEFAFQHCVLS